MAQIVADGVERSDVLADTVLTNHVYPDPVDACYRLGSADVPVLEMFRVDRHGAYFGKFVGVLDGPQIWIGFDLQTRRKRFRGPSAGENERAREDDWRIGFDTPCVPRRFNQLITWTYEYAI